jgi:hypothetical protein
MYCFSGHSPRWPSLIGSWEEAMHFTPLVSRSVRDQGEKKAPWRSLLQAA